MWRLLLCVLALSWLGFARGQSCVAFEPGPSIKCNDVVKYPVLLLGPQTMASLHETVQPQAVLLSAVLPYDCRQLALQLLCATNFVECLIINGTFVGYLPPCVSLCESMVASCSDFFNAQGEGSRLPDCTQIPASPVCNNGTGKVIAYTKVDCPYPLKFDYSDNDDEEETLSDPLTQYCVYPCPDPQFSYDEYQGGWGVAYGIGFISVFSGLFLITTWVLSPLKRRYPANLILWLGINATGVSFSMVMPVFWGGAENLICTWDDPPRNSYQNYAYDNGGQGVGCVLQGMLLIYTALGSNFWWVAICFNLFEIVVLEIDRTWIRVMHKLYHIIAWGWPAATVILLLAAQRVGQSVSGAYCFMASPNDRAESQAWVYGLYFSISAPTLLLGTALVSMVVCKVIYLKIKLGNRTTINLLHILRLFLLVACYWFILSLILVYFIYGSIVGDSIADAVTDQVTCSAKTGTECSLDKRQAYALWWLNLFSISSAGSVVFVTLGLTKETFSFWVRLFRGLCRKDISVIWKNLTQEITVGPTQQASDSDSATGMGDRTDRTDDEYYSEESAGDEDDAKEDDGEEMEEMDARSESNSNDSDDAIDSDDDVNL